MRHPYWCVQGPSKSASRRYYAYGKWVGTVTTMM